MRVNVESAIAIRSPNGVAFGTLKAVIGTRVSFELDESLFPGDPIEVQIEMKGYGRTLLVQAELLEAVTRRGAPNRYVAQIEFRSPTDRYLFGEWIAQSQTGGTSVNPNRQVMASTGSLPRALTAAEVEANLRRLDSKESKNTVSDPWGLSTSTSGKREGVGREAVRAALRAAVRPTPEAGPPPGAGPAVPSVGGQARGVDATPSTPPWRSREASVTPRAEAPYAAGPLPAPRLPAPRDPGSVSSTSSTVTRGGTVRLPSDIASFYVNLDVDPVAVVVVYTDRSIFQRDHTQYYSRRVLFVPCLGSKPPKGRIVEVTITLPSSMTVMGRAEVVAELTSGFGLQLQFEELSYRLLSLASQS